MAAPTSTRPASAGGWRKRAAPRAWTVRPQAFEEFSRLLEASTDYARDHLDEVAEAVSKDTGQEPAYFKWWNERDAEFPGTISDADIKAIAKTFELARELGILQSYPDPASLVCEHALRG